MQVGSFVRGGALLAVALGCSSSQSSEGGGGSGGAPSGTGGSSGASAAGGVASAGKGTAGSAPAAVRGAGSSGRAGASASGGKGGRGGSGGDTSRAGRGGTGDGAAGVAGEAGEGGTATGGSATVPAGCNHPTWDAADFDHVLEVGPGLDYETPSDVPWETITAGTLVRIHHRAEPYRDKWVVNSTGTADKPVVVLGVPEGDALPVISGENATTRAELDYWNENRGIVKVGAANAPAGPAAYVTIECLEITTARPGTSFEAADGSSTEYSENAACLYLEEGAHVTLRHNTVHGCGNGIFASSGSSDVLVSGNYVYDNGNDGSIYEHNSYTEALGITFEFNRYGPLCGTCDGNNLKDRSAGTVIRYNWIESGNRQLDLVESDHDELVADPRYHQTFVYGNVLVEPADAGNSQIVHYGGDGDDESLYRKGTLYFYGNTVVSTRGGNTTLFRLSTEDESVDARNNIASVTAGGDTLAISDGTGKATLTNNFLPTGWVDAHDTLTGVVEDLGNVEAAVPGFVDSSGQDFTLQASSPCVGAAGPLASEAGGYPVEFEYQRYQTGKPRPDDGHPDLGAFEAADCPCP